MVFIRSICIFVDILTVIRSFIFFNIKYEYNIALSIYRVFTVLVLVVYVVLYENDNFAKRFLH